MQRKSKYLWAALAASLCLTVALLVMLGMSLRRQPLTGTYLCEGLSPGTGTYLVFDGKGDYTLYRQSGVLSAVILGIGRAIGETMAVVMVAGNQAVIPSSIFDGVRTMTANIVLEMGYAADLHRGALIATGVVLFVFVMLISLLFGAIKKRGALR